MGASRRERAIRSAIILGTLTTVAGLLASGTTQRVAASLFPLEPEKVTGPVAPGSGDERPVRDSAESIARAVLSRNFFDSETGPLSWNPPAPPEELSEEEGEDTGEPQLPDGEPEDCESSARLVASMVVPDRPDLSFASIEEGGTALLYRRGMQVGDAQLVGIREQRVFLLPEDKPLCQIVMFKPAGSGAARASRTKDDEDEDKSKARPVRRRSGGLSDEDLDQGITKNSDTSFTVSRELVDKVLGNQAELMRSARIIPYEENGRTVGVKVYGIRRNSLLGRLGMQNGDVLRTINGFDMTSPDSALEAYTRLRSADNISISMMRRGQPSNLEYTIR